MDRFALVSAAAMVLHMTHPAAAQTPIDRFVTVNGLRLHYLERGTADKPTLILVHGNERHAHTFDHIAPEFTRDYRVIALDMRGHGEFGLEPGRRLSGRGPRQGSGGHHRAARPEEGDAVGQLHRRPGGAGLRRASIPDRVERAISEDVGPERPQDISQGFAKRVAREANGWASEDELVGELMKRAPRTPEAIVRNMARHGTKRRDDGRIIWKRDPNTVKGFVETELWQYVSKITSPIIYVHRRRQPDRSA